MIAGIVKAAWAAVVGHKIALAYYGAIALCIVTGAAGLYQWGYSVASGECKAAALQAEIVTLRADRDAANERAGRAALVVAALNERRYVTEHEIAGLRDELAKAKLQSTQPGAKHDPSALLDDNCNYTDRGIDRRRLRK
jgi:hypothetical protein